MGTAKVDLSDDEKEWRLNVYKLFYNRRPLIAKHFDYNRCIPLYGHGYSPGCAVLECMKMTNCKIFPGDTDYLIDK
jgi:hypothetical protein